jgi:pyruvate dehydrogenase E2 component (dihydrolipoamide acetyltransferase)
MQRVYDVDGKGRRYCQLDDFMLSLRYVSNCDRSYSCSLAVPVDMTEAVAFSRSRKDRTTVTAMVVRASAMALEHNPVLAGRWLDRIDRIYVPEAEGARIFLPVQVGDLSNGVWLERPVKKSLRDIAEELNREVKAVKSESRGNLFYPEPFLAISNVGTLGTIENASATLTGDVVSELVICSMIEKPWAVNGVIEPRKIMNLVMVWNHFAVLASTPAEFLMEVKGLLESPERL